jgi:RNA polymerase sigma factor (sigma-70 family)
MIDKESDEKSHPKLEGEQITDRLLALAIRMGTEVQAAAWRFICYFWMPFFKATIRNHQGDIDQTPYYLSIVAERLTLKIETETNFPFQIGKFKAYLNRSVYNEFLREKRKEKHFTSIDPNNPLEKPEEEDPFSPIYLTWGGIDLQEANAELTDYQRQVLELYWFEDKSHREIAEILQKEEATVKSTANKAKINLRKWFDSKK